MNLVINKCVTAVILSNFSRHYLRNRSTSDMGVFWVISVYFNVRNILPKSGTFPPGHPVYDLRADTSVRSCSVVAGRVVVISGPLEISATEICVTRGVAGG